ncbi:uncharacterized protein LOC135336905 [Halichondria panicea]|uniref:uncharacterized protein LOC135336905 n=1 Tax=Halichondria panicea TaxID=6063 RepID=UPI00312B424A
MKSIIVVAAIIALLSIQHTNAEVSIGFNKTAILASANSTVTVFVILDVTNGALNMTKSVQCTSTDETATEGEDYKRVNEPITFSPGGDLSQSVSVEILTNATKGNTFSLMLSKIDNNTLALFSPKVTITIAVSVGFTKDEIEISPGPSNSTFEVEVSVTGNIAEGDTTTIQLESSNTASIANREIELLSGKNLLTVNVTILEIVSIGETILETLNLTSSASNVKISSGLLTIKIVTTDTQKGLEAGDIAGIAVGSVVIVLLAIAAATILIVVLVKKRSKK